MSVSSSKPSARPVRDNKSGIEEKIWRRVELSTRQIFTSQFLSASFIGQCLSARNNIAQINFELPLLLKSPTHNHLIVKLLHKAIALEPVINFKWATPATSLTSCDPAQATENFA